MERRRRRTWRDARRTSLAAFLAFVLAFQGVPVQSLATAQELAGADEQVEEVSDAQVELTDDPAATSQADGGLEVVDPAADGDAVVGVVEGPESEGEPGVVQAAPEDETEAPIAEAKDADQAEDSQENKGASGAKSMPAFSQKATVDGVIVTVSAPEGTFPEGAKLSVKGVSAAKERKAEAAADEARDENREVAASYTFDIKVLDADGAELQPADGRQVEVSFTTAEVAEVPLTTEVFHIDDKTGKAEALDVTEDAAEETATATTDGFSTYAIMFTYQTTLYTMPEDSITLKTLMDAVGLNGSIDTVTSGDSDVIEVTAPAGAGTAATDAKDWILTAKADGNDASPVELTIALYERPTYRVYVTYTGTATTHQIKLLHMDGSEVTSDNPARSSEGIEIYSLC